MMILFARFLTAAAATLAADVVSASTVAFSGAPTYRLLDGLAMPQIGLGTYQIPPGRRTYDAVRWALDAGYRLIDTAAAYGNEASVGRALADSGLPREEVFLTTKLDSESHGYAEALKAATDSLERLDTPYVDLLLVHSPYGGRLVETWDALIKLREEGKAHSIGVSNFGVPHLDALLSHGRPLPAVNQIEMHPLIFRERTELVQYCMDREIVITAYGSLFSGRQEMYKDGLLRRAAEKHNKTVPQVLLRWALQEGFAVIPKASSSRKRQEENMAILEFALSDEEVAGLEGMEGEPLGEYWDPVEDAAIDVGSLSRGMKGQRTDL